MQRKCSVITFSDSFWPQEQRGCDCVSSETRRHHRPLHHHGLGGRSGERAALQSHEHHFWQCLLLPWEPASHCWQCRARFGLGELLALGVSAQLVCWAAGRTWLRECWREWPHLSWLLWLLAREPCDSLVKRVLSTMRHFFFPLWLYLFFSEVKRKQNVPTKLSTLKLYCSPMTQGEKFRGNEEEGKHSWIRSVVLSLKEEDDFAGWRTALLQHSEQEAKDGT